jgi:hypothetical protein
MLTKQVLIVLFACTSSVLAQTQPTGVIPGLGGYVKLLKACEGKEANAFCEGNGISGTCQEVSDACIVCKSCYMNYWADITRTIQ